jgi:hypothetical protein
VLQGITMAKRAKRAMQKTTQNEGNGTITYKRGRPPGKRSASSFSRLVAAEHKRLQKLRDKVHARKTQIDRELVEIERDLQAMSTFVSSGGQSGRRTSGRASSRGAGGRAGRGQRRQQVLHAIKSVADGATRGDIIERLNAKGDKALEQSISNALAALSKSKSVNRENGRYRAA